jgi:uronate dehydrogenase
VSRILVTGASGRIGTALALGMHTYGHLLRLIDRDPLPESVRGDVAMAHHEVVTADLCDDAALAAAMQGVSAVVHLAAIPSEAPFDDILRNNIDGTYRVFEAARRAGVRRIVYASSNHAVGFTPRAPLVGVDIRPRPDTYYGVSKVFGEALGSLYADRYGMAVACLRIGSFLQRPEQPRHLSTWLSHADAVRLVHAALTAPDLRFAVVYGISANTRGWWDLEPGHALGYHPVDDAEVYAAGILAAHGEPDLSSPEHAVLGGDFAGPEYDAPLTG